MQEPEAQGRSKLHLNGSRYKGTLSRDAISQHLSREVPCSVFQKLQSDVRHSLTSHCAN
jgi:hypothetical protein